MKVNTLKHECWPGPPTPLGRRCLWHYNQRQNLTLHLQTDLRALLHFIKGVIDWYTVLNTEHF